MPRHERGDAKITGDDDPIVRSIYKGGVPLSFSNTLNNKTAVHMQMEVTTSSSAYHAGAYSPQASISALISREQVLSG